MSNKLSGEPQIAPRLAVSVVVRQRERFLLVERANEPGKGMHAFPGGRVEDGEDLVQAALRELAEETALVGSNLVLLRDLLIPGKNGGFHLHVFLAGSASGNLVPGDDALSADWYTLADMSALAVPQSVLDVARNIIGNE
ncbi:MAG: NUDIX domain-containing protein [Rhizobiaceae bacterium]